LVVEGVSEIDLLEDGAAVNDFEEVGVSDAVRELLLAGVVELKAEGDLEGDPEVEGVFETELEALTERETELDEETEVEQVKDGADEPELLGGGVTDGV